MTQDFWRESKSTLSSQAERNEASAFLFTSVPGSHSDGHLPLQLNRDELQAHLDNITTHLLNSTSTFSNSSSIDEPPEKSTVVVVIICFLCGLVILGTLFGNILVCVAVAVTRKLRTPSNSLIVSLAFSDLLIAVTVMPFAVVLEVTGNWIFGQVFCDVWTSLDVLLCTSSILNLCVISIDRYLVITRPFTYALKRTPLRMATMISLVWVASAVISIPPQFGWRKPIKEGQCVISEEIGYQLFATVGAFYLPLLVMIIIYTRIYLVSQRLSKTISYNRQPSLASVGAPGSPADPLTSFQAATSNEASRRRRQSSPCFERSCYEAGMLGGTEKRRKSSSVLFFEKMNRLRSQHQKCQARKTSNPCTAESQPTLASHAAFASSAGSLSSSNKKFRSRSVSQMWGRINRLKLTSAKSQRTNSERKATRTLGVIMGSFVACWLPFFILALVKPFLGEFSHRIPRWIDTIFLWLGYANSFLNPIIYARFNRDFRVPFRYIIQCRCGSINNRMRVSEFVEQFGKSDSGLNPNALGRMAEQSGSVYNSQQFPQQRHKFSNSRQSQAQRIPLNRHLSVTVPEEQQFFIRNSTKLPNESPLSLAKKLSAAVSRPSGEKFKYQGASQNLVFKRYDPQNKRNNRSNSFKIIIEDAHGDVEDKYRISARSSALAPTESESETDVLERHRQGGTSPTLSPSIDEQQFALSSRCSTPTTNTKSRTHHKDNRRPNAHNHYKLYVPKTCHAPVINMSMVVDDDEDDDEDSDEKNSLKVVDDDDDDDDDDDAKNANGKLRQKLLLETIFPLEPPVDSSAECASNSSREYFKVRHPTVTRRQDSDQGRKNGILKVFGSSFSDMNEEQSFVI